MSQTYPLISLSKVLRVDIDAVSVNPSETYKFAGVYSFGRGLFYRAELSGSGTTYKKFHRIHEDQFVMSQPKGWEGALARVPKHFEGLFLSPVYPTFSANEQQLDIRYLEYYFRQEHTWDTLNRLSKGIGARRNSVYPEMLLSMEIPLPPLLEQRRIVQKIERLAAKIEEAQKLRKSNIEAASALFTVERAHVMVQAFQSGSKVLSEAATLERGKFSYRPRNDPRFFGGNHPWIQIGEIEAADKYIRRWSQTLNDEGLAISRKFPKGTLLISIAATIGSVGILDFDCCVPDSIVAITPKRDADSEFIYHYLGYLRTHLEDVAPQSAQKNINLRILTDLPFPRIDVNQQRRTVEYLDGLQSEVERLKKLQVETSIELDALLPSILDKAFRGEL